MKVAIIGAGNVGQALAGSFARAGHSVVVSDRNPEDSGELASRVGGTSAESPTEAVRQSEVVVLAVPFAASAESISGEIRDVVSGKIVIDPTNPLSQTGLTTAGGPSAGEHIQQWLPGAKVVKAFNTIFASKQADPTVDGDAVDVFVAGDDEQAKSTVLELASGMGFRAIDVGPLARATQLEGLAFMNIALQATKNGNWQSVWKLIDPPQAAVREPAVQVQGSSR